MRRWRYNEDKTYRECKGLRQWRCPHGHWIMFTITWRDNPKVCPECVAK